MNHIAVSHPGSDPEDVGKINSSNQKEQKNSPSIDFEIERRFLIDPSNPQLLALLEGAERSRFKQWYLFSSESDSETRVRMIVSSDKKTRYEHQQKTGHGISRKETDPVELSPHEALEMIDQAGTYGDPVEKIRYLIKSDDLIIEINQFLGVHSGLWTAEVEYPDLRQAEKFIPPGYFGKEVTDDTSFESSELSKKGIPKLYRHQAVNNIFSGKIRLHAALAIPILADQMIREAELKDNAPAMLFIGAPSAAGKGWVTDRLKEAVENTLGKGAVTILSTDRYFKGAKHNQTLTDERRTKAAKLGIDPLTVKAVTFDDPEGLDFKTLLKDILHMQEAQFGDSVDVPVYSFDTGERIGLESFTVGKIIVVEGLYALSDELSECQGSRVFINANEITRLIRRLSRDALERGFMNPGDQFHYHVNAIRPTVDSKIIPTALNAGLVIESNLDPVKERAHVPSNRSERQIKVSGAPSDTAFTRLHGSAETDLSQHDRYLIHPEDLSAPDPNYIRLRFIGEERKRAVCTYKWPSLNAGTERALLSFPVDLTALTAIEEIFAGGQEIAVFKNRTTWKIPVEGGSVYVNVDRDITRVERDGSVTRLPAHSEFLWDPHIREDCVLELIDTLMPGRKAEELTKFSYLLLNSELQNADSTKEIRP